MSGFFFKPKQYNYEISIDPTCLTTATNFKQEENIWKN